MVMKKMQASSLVEVIIATIILGIVFGVSLIVIINVSQSSSSFIKTFSQREMEHLAIQLKKVSIEEGEKRIDFPPVFIRQSITSYKNIPELYHIQLEAYRYDSVFVADYHEIYLEK